MRFRKDAVLAQEMDVALPIELTDEQNIELIKDFVYGAFVREGDDCRCEYAL
ncbi:MAG UNVERIFIED_CONTAM: MobA/MobL family protein [Rickettsiaceae bacterium]